MLYDVAIYSERFPPANLVKLPSTRSPLRDSRPRVLRLLQLKSSVFLRRRVPTMVAVLGQAPFDDDDRNLQSLSTIPPTRNLGRVVVIALVVLPTLLTRMPLPLLLVTNTSAPRYELVRSPLMQLTAPLITTAVRCLAAIGKWFMVILSRLVCRGPMFLFLLKQ